MANTHQDALSGPPDPASDRIDQKTLMAILGFSQHTGSMWAKAGRLRPYEHGCANCGRRRYSRWLVMREQQQRLEQATRRQDEQLEVREHPSRRKDPET